mmetsp:Transcript_67035/g.196036  ORF Transcript_67035/g.196036 Transcript_67035/m.196036 type:complete len:325 (+) Transcript_67035:483-1457(+)
MGCVSVVRIAGQDEVQPPHSDEDVVLLIVVGLASAVLDVHLRLHALHLVLKPKLSDHGVKVDVVREAPQVDTPCLDVAIGHGRPPVGVQHVVDRLVWRTQGLRIWQHPLPCVSQEAARRPGAKLCYLDALRGLLPSMKLGKLRRADVEGPGRQQLRGVEACHAAVAQCLWDLRGSDGRLLVGNGAHRVHLPQGLQPRQGLGLPGLIVNALHHADDLVGTPAWGQPLARLLRSHGPPELLNLLSGPHVAGLLRARRPRGLGQRRPQQRPQDPALLLAQALEGLRAGGHEGPLAPRRRPVVDHIWIVIPVEVLQVVAQLLHRGAAA